MIAAVLLAAAPVTAPTTAVDAERAFAADARTIGQWSAFRKWASIDAVMFTPQSVNAPTFLKNRKDPPRPIRWQPAASYVACDGNWAVNTGPWQRPDGTTGYFTTVWNRQSSGWRWMLDSGDSLATPRALPAKPRVRIAQCGGAGRMTGDDAGDFDGYGTSGDATLRWRWHVAADAGRELIVEIWNGKGYDRVIDDKIAAPK